MHAFITGWIARFGVPGISSDRGSQFTSSIWNEIAARLGVKFHHTSAYHSQANGMIERFHRTLKTALKARLTGPNWVEELPWVLLGLRITPKEDLGYSSAELVYGELLIIPGELVPPKSAKSMYDFLLNFMLNTPLYDSSFLRQINFYFSNRYLHHGFANQTIPHHPHTHIGQNRSEKMVSKLTFRQCEARNRQEDNYGYQAARSCPILKPLRPFFAPKIFYFEYRFHLFWVFIQNN